MIKPEQPRLRLKSGSASTYVAAVFLVLSQIICGLPLLVWPFALLASVMSLAAFGDHHTGTENPIVVLVVIAFCVSVIVYPIPYFVGLVFSWRSYRRRKVRQSVLLGMIAPLSFAFIALLLWAWRALGH